MSRSIKYMKINTSHVARNLKIASSALSHSSEYQEQGEEGLRLGSVVKPYLLVCLKWLLFCCLNFISAQQPFQSFFRCLLNNIKSIDSSSEERDSPVLLRKGERIPSFLHLHA